MSYPLGMGNESIISISISQMTKKSKHIFQIFVRLFSSKVLAFKLNLVLALIEERRCKMNKSERRIWNNKIRRQKERKQHFLIVIFTFCLVIGLSFSASVFLSYANAENENAGNRATRNENIGNESRKEERVGNERGTFKYYKSVIIEKGDTLWSIALQNIESDADDVHAYIKEVKKMNGLRDDTITAGMYLIIPCYSNG